MQRRQREDGAPLYNRREWLVGAGGLMVVTVFALARNDHSKPTQSGPAPTASGTLQYHSLNGASPDQRIQSAPDGSPVHLPPGVLSFADFDSFGYGIYARPDTPALLGAGTNQTVLQMAPFSSTKTALVPTAADSTNQFALLRAGGNSTTARITLVSDLTLAGTPQGHPYNGYIAYYQRAGKIARIKVTGIPGNSAAPPGETFGINVFHCVNQILEGVEVDGRDSNGTKVGATGFGHNYSTGTVHTDCYSHDQGFGHGFAAFQSADIVYLRPRSIGNAKAGMNFERSRGTIDIVDGSFAGNSEHLIVASDTESAKVTITDPVYDGDRFTVHVPNNYAYPPVPDPPPNRQLTTDISLVIGGVSRPDLLEILRS
jgi:hypothetical protein